MPFSYFGSSIVSITPGSIKLGLPLYVFEEHRTRLTVGGAQSPEQVTLKRFYT